MTTDGMEIESKFLVHDLAQVEARLVELGAHCIQPRVYERNLRFDLPDGRLRQEFKVLRLRQDTQAILTYKGPGGMLDGIRAREELEVVVSDFDTAQSILEALGYSIFLYYEKFRATYTIDTNTIMLDDTPIGRFVEIEGKGSQDIFGLAEKLGLDKSASICDSYQMLFERARTNLNLDVNNLSFDEIGNKSIPPEAMQIKFAA